MSKGISKITAREAALKVLSSHRQKKAWSELALNSVIKSANLSTLDTRLTVQLVYGALQNMTLCDYYASKYSTMPLKKLEPRVLDILRLSIYQILFLDKIPHNAAANEGVALTKKFSNQRAAGFVNAVLRKISKGKNEKTLPEITGDDLDILSIKYSHPKWLAAKISKRFGPEQTKLFFKANNLDNIPITIQINTLLTNEKQVYDMLLEEGINVFKHDFLPDALEFRGGGNFIFTKAFTDGYYYVQDTAAKLSVIAAEPKPGDCVIDGCSAPGGKSFAAAILMKNEGQIFSCDIHPAKLRHIKEGSKRLGISIISAIEMDASKDVASQIVRATDTYSREYNIISEGADVVIADVPCSGFGIIRKKPEIRYKSYEDVKDLPKIQKGILNQLSKYVKPGGTLLYSTCTILKEENEDVVDSFLSENPEFSLQGFTLPGIGEVGEGRITLLPQINGTDGFFICKMKRTG